MSVINYPCTSSVSSPNLPHDSLNTLVLTPWITEAAPAAKKRKTAPASTEELPAKPVVKAVDNGAEPKEEDEDEDEEEEEEDEEDVDEGP